MEPQNKTIFHVDMDAFFVSVEELFDPSLKGKAVVVGGQRDERGVVSAASYAARKFGVHSAMPLRTAAKLCPNAVFVDGHPERYRECSEKVYEVLNHFSPQVDLAPIDESGLDEYFGKWGLAVARKARGDDAGGWFDSEVGADTDPKSISHEHTYNDDTAHQEQLESTLMRLSEMVGRRLREAGL